MTVPAPERTMTTAPLAGTRGVLFDVDDTLVDTRASFRNALAAVARSYLPHLEPGAAEDLLWHWRQDPGGHYARYTRGEVDQTEQRRLRANELHAAFGGPQVPADEFEPWNALYLAGFDSDWQAFPDAAPTLRAIANAGIAVGLLTNATEDSTRTKLAAVGLTDLAPLLVAVDTLGVGKPDPRVFHEAARRLGMMPVETAYVGDELDGDVLGAIATGMGGVWLDRPGTRRGGTRFREDPAIAHDGGAHVISSLTELPGLLGVPA